MTIPEEGQQIIINYKNALTQLVSKIINTQSYLLIKQDLDTILRLEQELKQLDDKIDKHISNTQLIKSLDHKLLSQDKLLSSLTSELTSISIPLANKITSVKQLFNKRKLMTNNQLDVELSIAYSLKINKYTVHDIDDEQPPYPNELKMRSGILFHKNNKTVQQEKQENNNIVSNNIDDGIIEPFFNSNGKQEVDLGSDLFDDY